MSNNTKNGISTKETGRQLVEALANIWFQAVIVGILLLSTLLLIGSSIALWQWLIMLSIPVVTWWFGKWYGKFNEADIDSPSNQL